MSKMNSIDPPIFIPVNKKNIVEHHKFPDGREHWREYDERGNVIHYKNSDDHEEVWKKYDENHNFRFNIIHYKDSNGYESWRRVNERGNVINYKNSDGHEVDDNELFRTEVWKKPYVKHNMKQKLKEFYLSWFNDYLTVGHMAQDYDITEKDCKVFIDLGRKYVILEQKSPHET